MAWQHRKGRHLSAATKAKIRASLKHRRSAGAKRAVSKRHGHRMSVTAKARLRASLRASAVKRKALGLKRKVKPRTTTQRARLSASLRAAAVRRKAAGIKIHRKPSTKKHVSHVTKSRHITRRHSSGRRRRK